jgi:Cu-processing system permease protein
VLLAQPIGRRQLFAGLYLGLAAPLSAGFALGVGVPFLLHGIDETNQRATLATLLCVGVALTFVFTALAFLVSLRVEEKVKGLGIAIALWLGAAVLYDGAILLIATMFADYPLERPLLGLMLANPVDLARIVLLLQFDVAALMGYTGAVFKSFFGSVGGRVLAASTLLLWAAVPVLLGMRAFRRKDF